MFDAGYSSSVLEASDFSEEHEIYTDYDGCHRHHVPVCPFQLTHIKSQSPTTASRPESRSANKERAAGRGDPLSAVAYGVSSF
jgi:hypothetical protein